MVSLPRMPPHEQARLALLARTALLDTPPEIEFDRIVQLACALFGLPSAMISLVDKQRLFLKAKVGLDLCEIPRESSFCTQVVASARPLVVSDARLDPAFAGHELVRQPDGIRFYAGAPLRIDTQHIIGTLCLLDHQPRSFDDNQLALLQALADTVSDLIRKRMALALGARQSKLLVTINQAQNDFLQDHHLARACQTIMQPMLDMSEAGMGFIARCEHDPAGQAFLDIPAIIHHQPDQLAWLLPQVQPYAQGYRLPDLDNVFGQAIADGQPLLLNQPNHADRPWPDESLHNLAVLPCFFHFSVMGVLVLANRPGGFDQDLIEHLAPLCHSIGTLLHVRGLENARQAAEAELARRATLDPLTGLLNRRAFMEHCQQSQQRFARYGQPYSLLMLDLDHFKALNDRLGHAAGDHVLKTVGWHLQQQLRDGDIVARWGGEEFCILLPQETEAGALQLANRLCRTLATLALDWHEQPLQITASIGIATRQTAGESTSGLIERADAAMYQAKRAGRNCARLADSA